MYVCGKGTDNFGTVLPAVMQFSQRNLLDQVQIAARSKKSLTILDHKLEQLKNSLNIPLEPVFYPYDSAFDPDSYLKALKELPDPGVVIIVTPDDLHYEMALACINAGKHILVVKPLTPTIKEARQLADAAKKANVYGAVEFHKRWDLANLKLKEAISTGKIGDPLYFHVEYSQRKKIPSEIFSSWAEKTNIFQYIGVHYADIIYFVTGSRPERLIATRQAKWLTGKGINTSDAIQVLIEWSDGFVSTILTNWIDPDRSTAMSQQLIKAVGTKGRIESDQTDRGIHITGDLDGVEYFNPYFCQPYRDSDSNAIRYKGYGIDSITQFLSDTANIVQGSLAPQDLEGRRPTFNDALVSTAIVEGVNISLFQNGQWVYFGDDLVPYTE